MINKVCNGNMDILCYRCRNLLEGRFGEPVSALPAPVLHALEHHDAWRTRDSQILRVLISVEDPVIGKNSDQRTLYLERREIVKFYRINIEYNFKSLVFVFILLVIDIPLMSS